MSRSSKSFVGTVLGVETTTDEKQKRSTVESEPLLFSLSDLQCSFREGLGAGDESDEASLRESLELRGDSEADEEKPSVAKAMPRKMLSMEEMREVVAEQSMSTRSPGLEEVVQYFSVPMGRTDSVMSADENQYAPKRKKSEKNKGRRQSPVGYEGSSPPASDINTGSGPTRLNTSKQSVTELERQRIAREITLEELMAAQTAEGSFKLDDDVLKHRFTYWRFDLLADELGEDILHTNLERVLDTARAIVFIYVMYPDSDELWRLVVQKADGFVETVISDKEWRRLFRVLRSQLRDGREKTIQAFRDSRWFQGRHRFLAGGFDLILRSHILDDPHELRRLLRSCIRDRTYSQKGLIQNLGRKIQDTKADGQLYEAKIKDFDEWTDGWDDVLKLSLGIRSVMREMGYLEP
jgi:hypothetical protein